MWSHRRLQFECLEERRYLSATPAQAGFVGSIDEPLAAAVSADDPQPAELDLNDPAVVQTLVPAQYRLLSNTQVRYLSETQIRGIVEYMVTPGFWPGVSFKSSTPLTTGFSPQQIGWLNVANHNVPLVFLDRAQLDYLTPAQIRTLGKMDFYELPAAQVQYLTQAQLATVSDTEFETDWAATSRTGLTQVQVPWLTMGNRKILRLTPAQREWLTSAQIAQVTIPDLQLVPVGLTQHILTSTLAQIHDRNILGGWKFTNLAGFSNLNSGQIQALDMSDTQSVFLTSQQRLWLTDAQLAKLKFSEWRNDEFGIYLTPEQISRVPLSVFASFKYPEVKLRTVTPLQQTGYTRAQLLSAGHGTAGDFDQDGAIDGSDLSAKWRPNFGQQAGASAVQGDADGNGVVNGNDFLLWQRGNGATPAADLWDDFMFTESTQKAPVGTYTPAVDIPIGPDGLAHTAAGHAEADAALALMPFGFQTHTAVGNGNWDNPAIWSGNAVPGAGAKVLIPAGKSVIYNANSPAPIAMMRVDGTLTFAPNANTLLVIDTIMIDTYGKLNIGTPTVPIGDAFKARIEFPVLSDINTTWDPTLVSRGLVSHGTVRMFGKTVTPFVEFAIQPALGATQLVLATTPTNWAVGDKLVLAGTIANRPDFGVEERTILAISNNIVTVAPLQFAHQAPAGYGLKVHVANVERNIEFRSQTTDWNANRSRLPHIMFLHNPDVQIANIHVVGFGRTDKTRPIVEPNEVVPGGPAVNPRGRYALHFHHTGVNPNSAARTVTGSSLENGPGWGYVNHQSNVIMEDNFAHNFDGASFVTEDGNEIGAFRRNLSITNVGMDYVPGATDEDKTVRARAAIHDFGHTGNGFWLQGPGVELSDNIANATAGPAFAIFAASSKAMFDAINLPNPALAGGQTAIPVEAAPLKGFARNTSYGVVGSWDMWYLNPTLPGSPSVIDGFTSWSQRLVGIAIHYSGDVTLKNILVLGDLSYPVHPVANPTIGLVMSSGVENVTVENAVIRGFDVGMYTTYRQNTTVRNTTIAAVNAVRIPESQDSWFRTINIESSVQFETLTPTLLQGRLQTYYNLNGGFANVSTAGVVDYHHLTYGSVVTPVNIHVYMPGVGQVKLYFNQQQASYVPFSTQRSPGETAAVLADPSIRPEYRNLTNAQLWSLYHISYGMEMSPGGAITSSLITGGLYSFAAEVP